MGAGSRNWISGKAEGPLSNEPSTQSHVLRVVIFFCVNTKLHFDKFNELMEMSDKVDMDYVVKVLL